MHPRAAPSSTSASRIPKIQPSTGQLLPLRTKAELQAKHETIDVYVCQVPVKDTANVLGALKSIHNQHTVDLHHLRRVVKEGYQPEWLQQHETASVQGTVHVLLVPTSWISRSDMFNLLQRRLPHVFISSPLDTDTSASEISAKVQALEKIFVRPVPLHPPTSYSHALKQSQTLWPTTYNPNTAYGPNPADLASAQSEIEPNAGAYMALARRIAREAKECGRGEGIGVVVVESLKDIAENEDSITINNPRERRTEALEEVIVCIAGDARFCGQGVSASSTSKVPNETANAAIPSNTTRRDSKNEKGNPSNHAIMRAIEMIAHKRRALLHERTATSSSALAFQDVSGETYPSQSASSTFTQLENSYLQEDSLQPDGYLCLNLHIYTTHEPCIMCSMALVHSRVGRVVFGRRMPLTGGLCAGATDKAKEDLGESEREDLNAPLQEAESLGYGLFWRQELNWRFLCWEWQDDAASEAGQQDQTSDEALVSEEDDVRSDVHA